METTNSNYFGTEKISRILLNIISGSRFFYSAGGTADLYCAGDQL